MIPKKIHYCWFGRGPKSELIQRCMDSWKKQLPEYEIIEWNEDNFDINQNKYAQQAYENKKWAFVSDYVRLWTLYNHGGVYLDSDVEVFKSFNLLLSHRAFTGFEKTYNNILSPVTAVMGAEEAHPWILSLLSHYDKTEFVLKDGSFNLQTNTVTISTFMVESYNVQIEDRYQVLKDDLHIYPSWILCNKSSESYAVHHFDGSWKNPQHKMLSKIKKTCYKLLDL